MLIENFKVNSPDVKYENDAISATYRYDNTDLQRGNDGKWIVTPTSTEYQFRTSTKVPRLGWAPPPKDDRSLYDYICIACMPNEILARHHHVCSMPKNLYVTKHFIEICFSRPLCVSHRASISSEGRAVRSRQ